jgi:hypothetical protein
MAFWRQRTLTPKILDVTILWRQSFLKPHPGAPNFQDAGEAESPRFGASGRLFRPLRHLPHPAKAWGLPGAVPRLPPGFRGQDRAASALLCPLKPGIGRGRPGRSGRVIPGRNPAGSPGFAWGRRVQGRAFPGEDRGEAGETGPARGVGAPVCPFSERRTFAVWRMGAHPAHGAPDPHPNPRPAPRRASPPPGRSFQQNPAGSLPDPPGF